MILGGTSYHKKVSKFYDQTLIFFAEWQELRLM